MLSAFDGGRLFGSRSGDAPARVLALHGWGRTHRDFDAVFAPGGRPVPVGVVAIDLPGFGASPPPPEAWGGAEYAEALAPVLADMARPVVVLGHSFGGRVAVHLAAHRPEEVAGLVLTGVPLLRTGAPRRPAAAYRLLRALRRLGLVGEARLEAARRRYGSADYRAAEGVMRAVHVRSVHETYEAQLERVRCPVRLVWGADDTAVPVAVADRALAILQRAGAPAPRLEVRPGQGHLLPLGEPDVLRAAVEDLLR